MPEVFQLIFNFHLNLYYLTLPSLSIFLLDIFDHKYHMPDVFNNFPLYQNFNKLNEL